jgi:hypothetical protein
MNNNTTDISVSTNPDGNIDELAIGDNKGNRIILTRKCLTDILPLLKTWLSTGRFLNQNGETV